MSGEEAGVTRPAPAPPPAESGGNRIVGPTEVGVTTGTGWTTATYQDPEEARHQRDIEKSKLDYEQKKERDEIRRQTIGQALAMVLVVLVALDCLRVIVSNRYPTTTVDKAAAVLLLILGGFVGYITGQATKK